MTGHYSHETAEPTPHQRKRSAQIRKDKGYLEQSFARCVGQVRVPRSQVSELYVAVHWVPEGLVPL